MDWLFRLIRECWFLDSVETTRNTECRKETNRRVEFQTEWESFTDRKTPIEKNSHWESIDFYGMIYLLTVGLVCRFDWTLNYRKLDWLENCFKQKRIPLDYWPRIVLWQKTALLENVKLRVDSFFDSDFKRSTIDRNSTRRKIKTGGNIV